MQKTAMIWGVTGQDGSYLADFLLQKGYEVIGVARRVSVDTTSRLCLAKKNERFTLVEGDVTDQLCVYRLIQQHLPEEIYNLAAQSHVGTSFDQPSLTFDVTAKGCLNCLEAIRSLQADGCSYVGTLKGSPRFYQASSSEMFGSMYSAKYDFDGWNIEKHYDYKERPKPGSLPYKYKDHFELTEPYQCERTPMVPNSPYAIAKLTGHNLCRVYRDAYGIHASSGILFNHESARRGDNFVTKKISRWVAGLYEANRKAAGVRLTVGSDFTEVAREVIQNGFPRIKLGNLDACRDWGYAPDYVEAMWLMLQQASPADYVVATGETHSVREFLETALGCIGVDLKAEDVVETDKSLLRPSEVPYLRGDASKARAKLSWKPKVDFKGLVKTMVAADVGVLLGNGKGGCA